jgi:hypothetical protein
MLQFTCSKEFKGKKNPLNRFIHSKMQNYVSFCLKIPAEGEKNFLCIYKTLTQKFDVIMSTFNPHLPLLGKYSDPLKILQNGGKAGKNTRSQNLGLAGLLVLLLNFLQTFH